MFARTLALLSLSLFMLSGCASLVVSGATTTGVVAAQERTFGRAIDDATVKASIYSKFLRKDVNDLLIHVDVQVDEGRVMLTGNVNNPQTVVEAVRIAWQVEGVREVINEIQIQNKGGWQNYITDAWISNNIRGRMLLAKDVRSINYNVETVNGVPARHRLDAGRTR